VQRAPWPALTMHPGRASSKNGAFTHVSSLWRFTGAPHGRGDMRLVLTDNARAMHQQDTINNARMVGHNALLLRTDPTCTTAHSQRLGGPWLGVQAADECIAQRAGTATRLDAHLTASSHLPWAPHPHPHPPAKRTMQASHTRPHSKARCSVPMPSPRNTQELARHKQAAVKSCLCKPSKN
jgi:hypothetical protein